MRFNLAILGVFWVALCFSAHAETRYPVGAIPTLECMALNVTDQQAMDLNFVVPVRQEPSASAPSVGRASAIVLVRKPEIIENGYVAAVLFNGIQGWVLASSIRPWHSMNGGPQRCIPSRMSDGSIGFNIK